MTPSIQGPGLRKFRAVALGKQDWSSCFEGLLAPAKYEAVLSFFVLGKPTGNTTVLEVPFEHASLKLWSSWLLGPHFLTAMLVCHPLYRTG